MKLFRDLDADGSDRLDAAEFAEALARAGVGGASAAAVAAVLALADQDGDGVLEYRELVAKLERW